VGYLATNPKAQYIVAGPGALATGGRNTLATEPTNDISLSTYKDINITERMKFRIGAQFANIINHPQFIPGSNPGQGLGVNDVASFNTTTSNYLNYLTPSNPNFNNPRSVFRQQRSYDRVGSEVHLLKARNYVNWTGPNSGPVFFAANPSGGVTCAAVPMKFGSHPLQLHRMTKVPVYPQILPA